MVIVIVRSGKRSCVRKSIRTVTATRMSVCGCLRLRSKTAATVVSRRIGLSPDIAELIWSCCYIFKVEKLRFSKGRKLSSPLWRSTAAAENDRIINDCVLTLRVEVTLQALTASASTGMKTPKHSTSAKYGI